MNGFMTTKEAAERWNITVRQVQNHCKNGRIIGVMKIGTNWLIPEGTQRPKYTFLCEVSNVDKTKTVEQKENIL